MFVSVPRKHGTIVQTAINDNIPQKLFIDKTVLQIEKLFYGYW